MFIHQQSLQNQNAEKSVLSKQQRLSIENNKVILSQSFGLGSERKNTIQSPYRVPRLDQQSVSFCGVTASNFSRLGVNSNIHEEENTKQKKKSVQIEENDTQFMQHLNYMQLIYDVLFKFFPEGILFLNKEKELIQCNDSIREILQKQGDEDLVNTLLNITVQEYPEKIKGMNGTTNQNSYAGTSIFTQGTLMSNQQKNSNRLILTADHDNSINQTFATSYLIQPNNVNKKQRKSYFESINNKRQESEESKKAFSVKKINQEQSYEEINIIGQDGENGSAQSSQVNREKSSTFAHQNFQNEFQKLNTNTNSQPITITIGQYIDNLIELTKSFILQNPSIENIIFTDVQVFNVDLDNKPACASHNNIHNQQNDQKSIGSQTFFQQEPSKSFFEIKCFQCIINKAPVILVLIRDISYQKQISKLKTYASNKSQMVNFVSHEIRTPLNCIIAMLDTCDIKDEKINNALLNSKYLLNLSNDLLDLAQIKAGKFKINYQKINLKEILGECIYLFEYRAQQQRIILEFKFQDSLPEYIVSDPHRIKQVTINLLSNAFKFTLQGTVTLEVSCIKQFKRKLIQVSVHDSGVGIKKENLKLLFKAFGKEEEKRITMNSQGVGLGLLISNLIAQQLSNPKQQQQQLEHQSINEFKRSPTQNSQAQKFAQNNSQLLQGISVSSETGKGSSFSFYIDYTGSSQMNDQFVNPYSTKLINDISRQANTQNCITTHIDEENLLCGDDEEDISRPGILYSNSPYTNITELTKINKFQNVNKRVYSNTSNDTFTHSSINIMDSFEKKQGLEKKNFPNTLIGEIDIPDINNNLVTFYNLDKNVNSININTSAQQIDQTNLNCNNENTKAVKKFSILNDFISPRLSSQHISQNSISVNDLSSYPIKQSKYTFANSSTTGKFLSTQKIQQINGTPDNLSIDSQKNDYTIKLNSISNFHHYQTPQRQSVLTMTQDSATNTLSILQKECKCSQVLICDDNPFNLSALSTLLNRLNIKSDQVLSGQQAEQILIDRLNNGVCCKTYLIVFMDIEMPLQNGFQTTINIRNLLQKKQPLVIPCSSYSNSSEKLVAASYGMHSYLVKPIFFEHLKQFMVEICSSYSLQSIVKEQQND